jgi:hypothetical protein
MNNKTSEFLKTFEKAIETITDRSCKILKKADYNIEEIKKVTKDVQSIIRANIIKISEALNDEEVDQDNNETPEGQEE